MPEILANLKSHIYPFFEFFSEKSMNKWFDPMTRDDFYADSHCALGLLIAPIGDRIISNFRKIRKSENSRLSGHAALRKHLGPRSLLGPL